PSVWVQHVGAALDQTFHCADFVDNTATAALVQRGAKHVAGLEGDHVHSRCFAMRLGASQAALFCSDEKCGFRGITFDFDPALLPHELRVVAKKTRPKTFGEGNIIRRCHALARATNVTLRFVTTAGYREEAVAGEKLADSHLVFRERTGFVG